MAEQRLIDANALSGKGEVLYQHTASGKIIPWAAVRVCVINNAPPIDAVPVVRCRECIHRGYDACPMCHDEYYYDEDDGADFWTVDNTEDDGFCHMGAKMNGGAEWL